mmetsp:Transcript_55270/g.155114  ORF Transcript_55270/g.155114 Transcript_55270/m.155114 type:complete len:160 (-) Transcript_55270:71-550(-)
MRNFLKLIFAGLAVGRKPTTWLIDGNNFLGQKGTPRDAEVLADKLKPVAAAEQLILVFDGRPGESRNELSEGKFRHIKLEEGMSADDFILEEIKVIAAESKQNRIKLVTADKRLRSFALDTRPTVKSVVNPKTFWRKHYPRMSGMKKRVGGDDQSELTP